MRPEPDCHEAAPDCLKDLDRVGGWCERSSLAGGNSGCTYTTGVAALPSRRAPWLLPHCPSIPFRHPVAKSPSPYRTRSSRLLGSDSVSEGSYQLVRVRTANSGANKLLASQYLNGKA